MSLRPLLASLLLLIAVPAFGSNIIVTSSADAGPGSLRQAVLDTNAASGADTISFDSSLDDQTITLTGGSLSVTDALIIDASSLLHGVTISGRDARAFST